MPNSLSPNNLGNPALRLGPLEIVRTLTPESPLEEEIALIARLSCVGEEGSAIDVIALLGAHFFYSKFILNQ